MSLISQPIPGFFNGVSQQAATVRRSNQLELQENALGTLVDGLIKRPNTKYLATLTSNAENGCFVHKINRDTDERYIALVVGDEFEPIEVYTVGGVKCTVKYGELDEDLNFTQKLTVREYITGDPKTLIVNGDMELNSDWTLYGSCGVQEQSSTHAHTGTYSWRLKNVSGASGVKQDFSVTSGKTYRITYWCYGNGIGQWYVRISDGSYIYDSTPHYASAGWTKHVVELGPVQASTTGYIALIGDGVGTDEEIWWDDVVVQDMDDLPQDDGFTMAEKFKAITVADHTFISNIKRVVTQETDANTDTLTGTVQTFADLPSSPTSGDVYKITGDGSTGFDDWWVKWNGTVWSETIKPTEKLGKLTDSNMPHRLVRTDTNEFTFAPCIWEDRTVGSKKTNPLPSFVGQTINNLLFFKNRLGFLSDDNVIMSQTGEYYNFYATTTLDVLDDAPIDVSATSNQVQVLRASATFDKSIILFADQQQFDLGSGSASLSPNTIAITPTTKFNIDETCEPVTAGPNVYFVVPKTNYASLREYYIQSESLISDAADVTGHIPEYIPMGQIQLEACNSLDIIFALSDADPDSFYIYKYFWAGEEKVQSSWSKWIFNGTILGMAIIQTTVYLVIERDSVIYLETMELENEETGSLGFRVHLDRLTSPLTGVYSSGDGWTTWTLPFNIEDGLDMSLINSSNGLELAGVTKVAANQVRVTGGDYSGTDYYWGENYDMTARLTEWVMKNSRNEAITEGRLQTRTLTLDFKDTGYFRVEVTPFRRDTMTTVLTKDMTGVYVGISTIGEVSLMTGKEKFMILAKARQTIVEIINDTYLPCALQHGTWEGIYHPRSKSI